MKTTNLKNLIESIIKEEIEAFEEVVDLEEKSLSERLKNVFYEEGLDTLASISDAVESGDQKQLRRTIEDAFELVDEKIESTNPELADIVHLLGGEKEKAISEIMDDLLRMQREAEQNPHRLNEAEYNGKKVQLGKPMRGDVKKYKVYVKDPKTGRVKKVNFGDPNMKIKRNDPKRRKSFRARHKCDQAKDRTTPKYWSCRFWSKTPVSKMV